MIEQRQQINTSTFGTIQFGVHVNDFFVVVIAVSCWCQFKYSHIVDYITNELTTTIANKSKTIGLKNGKEHIERNRRIGKKQHDQKWCNRQHRKRMNK